MDVENEMDQKDIINTAKTQSTLSSK